MDRERAEAHLRLVAETELHGITTRPQDGAPLPPDIPGGGHGARGRRQQAAAAAALYALPRHQRQVIALQYYADLSEYETTAAGSRGRPQTATAALPWPPRFPTWTGSGSRSSGCTIPGTAPSCSRRPAACRRTHMKAGWAWNRTSR
jgi:hypothetical protein